MSIDRDAFFSAVKPVFGTRFKQSQVDGLNTYLDEWERRGLTDLRWLAYMIATDCQEDGIDMVPKREDLNYAAERMMEIPGWARKIGSLAKARQYEHQPEKFGNFIYANMLGNGPPESGDGYRYRGGGPPQLTGRLNYRNTGRLIGVDLEAHPETITDRRISTLVLFDGMITGAFTQKGLGHYFNDTAEDWHNARFITAGGSLFEADTVAARAQRIYAALRGAWRDRPASPPPPPDDPGPVPVVDAEEPTPPETGNHPAVPGVIATATAAAGAWVWNAFGWIGLVVVVGAVGYLLIRYGKQLGGLFRRRSN